MVRQHFPMPVITRLTIVMLFWILFLAILYEFRNFLYPLFLGVLFAYLFYPLASFFEKNKIPRILANLLSIIIGISILYGFLIFIYRRLLGFMVNLPELEEQAVSNIKNIFQYVENSIGLTTDPEEGEILNLTQQFSSRALKVSEIPLRLPLILSSQSLSCPCISFSFYTTATSLKILL